VKTGIDPSQAKFKTTGAKTTLTKQNNKIKDSDESDNEDKQPQQFGQQMVETVGWDDNHSLRRMN